MDFQNFGPRALKAGAVQFPRGVRIFDGNGFPTSGPTGTGMGSAVGAPVGSIYVDAETGTAFVNKGSVTSPYWYPVHCGQEGIAGIGTDFRNAHGNAAGVDNYLGGSAATSQKDEGVLYFGLGRDETTNTDVVPSSPVGGPIVTVGTENQANYCTALGLSTTALWTPVANGPLVIEANFTAITDILTRSFFLGFGGVFVTALQPLVTGATVTLTFSAATNAGDDVAGLFMDSRLTVAAGIFAPIVKANAVATVSTTVAALTVPSTLPAAATYSRWRVEIDAAGTFRAFINKAEVLKVASASTTTTALSPAFIHANSTTTAALSMKVREFFAYAKR
jgi:hypothetical protein